MSTELPPEAEIAAMRRLMNLAPFKHDFALVTVVVIAGVAGFFLMLIMLS